MKYRSLTYIGAFGGKVQNGQTMFSKNFIDSLRKLDLEICSINSQTFNPTDGTRKSSFNFSLISKFIKFFFRVISSKKTDIAIVSLSLSETSIYKFFPILVLLKIRGIKSFVMMHDGSPTNHIKKYNSITKIIFNLIFKHIVHGSLVLGKSQKKEWKKIFPALETKEIYGAREDPGMPVKNNKIRLTYISHFFESKGQHDLLKVWDKVDAKHKKVFNLTLAGGNQDSSYLEQILADKREGLEIIVSPSYSEIQNILSETEIFLMPSTYDFEAQPAVLIEAMSYRIPIIAYDWAGIPDLVNNKNGTLIEPKNIDEFACVLESYLNDDQLRKKKSLESYGYFLKEYDLKKWHEKLKIILESI